MVKIAEEDLLKELGFFESRLGDILKKSHTGIKGLAKMLYISGVLTYLRKKEEIRFDCLMTALLQTMLDSIKKSLFPLNLEEIKKEISTKKEKYPKLVTLYLDGDIEMGDGDIRENITKENIEELRKFFFSHEFFELTHINK